MSYFKRDAKESRFVIDRVPVYVFPAFVGSGRILLGMALAGLTTALLLHTQAAEPLFWWVGLLAYVSSLVLVISGIFAINIVPPAPPKWAPPESSDEPPLPQRRATKEPGIATAPPIPHDHHHDTRLGDLLVNRWHVITSQQLARALTQQRNTGRPLGYILTRMGLLTDATLERILGLQAADQDPWHSAPRND